jgi:hypothetical protein
MTAKEKYEEFQDNPYDPCDDHLFPDPEFSPEAMRQQMLC